MEWSGAYYLAGYAVECGLKACIAKLFKTDVFPKKTFSDKCYIHDIDKLIVFAELKAECEVDCKANLNLGGNWTTAKQWTEASRYDRKAQKDAQDLFDAITNHPDGVFAWIQAHW